MKKLKTNKGITLIALVITIIVLLILAAVSIATLTGENGILTRASDSANKSKEAEEREQIGLAYNAAMAESKGTEVTQTQLETELKKYDNGITVEPDGNNFKVTYPNGHEYTVESNGSITGPKTGETPTPPEEEKLAKEVLQINPNADEDYKKSPYVKYKGITCRVLYNDEYEDRKHGLQIISADNEGEVTLGYGDDKVTASDFDYEGTIIDDETKDEQFKHAAASYNRAVDTLNEKAKTYKDTNGIAIDARSLGSLATLKNGKFQGDITEKYFDLTKYSLPTLTEQFLDIDDNYVEDVGETTGQLQKLSLNATSDTWLASRYSEGIPGLYTFYILSVSSDGNLMKTRRPLCHYQNGSRLYFDHLLGFRPVFLLSSDVKITGGDGTKSSPYELGI